MAYPGITTKKSKNGVNNVYVRFKHLGRTYPVKNFTRLFGCKTETQAYNKLQEIKVLISNGTNPFLNTPYTLNEIWDKRFERKVKNKEWTNNTVKNYKYFYEAHIRNTIGHKKLDKIIYEDLLKVLDKLSDRQGGTKNTFKRLMRPLFEEAIKNGIIQENVINKLETQKEGSDKNISLKTSKSSLSILRKLYNAIPQYKVLKKHQDPEIRMFLYMVILTAHRKGELMKLKKENVVMEEKKIISPASITKTKEDYHFPIPKECLSYIDNIESGLLFPTIAVGSTYEMFQRLIRLTDIKFYNEKSLSIHDTRRLMLNTMITNCKIDGMLADACLSHKQRGVVQHYLSFSYKDIKKSYKKFWKKIR